MPTSMTGSTQRVGRSRKRRCGSSHCNRLKSAPAGTTRSIHGSSIEVRCPGCAVLVPVASDRHPGFTALLTLKDYLFAAFTGCLQIFGSADHRRPAKPLWSVGLAPAMLAGVTVLVALVPEPRA